MTLEDTIIRIQKELLGLDYQKLQQLCTRLTISTEGKTNHRQLLRLIEGHIDEVCDTKPQDEAVLYTAELEGLLSTLFPKESAVKTSDQLSTLIQKSDSKIPTVNVKREFRIRGQIGNPGQKDKLTYGNLVYQIEAGLKDGHSESAIVDEIIRSVCPGDLRNYLERKTKLSLSTLRQILHAHCKERDATELYHELSTATQGKDEDAYAFVLRALDIKQKILSASMDPDSQISYDERLVHRMFLSALKTGIRNDNIRVDLKPYLNDTTTDEVFLQMA